MTVKELAKDLNKRIEKVDFNFIHYHSEFHREIKLHILPLPAGLNLMPWEIFYNDNPENKIISYDRDFKQYKNSSNYIMRGKFSNVRFSAYPELEDLDIAELDDFFKQKNLLLKIKNLEEYVLTHEKETENAKKELEVLIEIYTGILLKSKEGS